MACCRRQAKTTTQEGGVSCDYQPEEAAADYVMWLQVKTARPRIPERGNSGTNGWMRDGIIMTEETTLGRIRIWEPEIGADPCCVVAPGWR